MLKKNSPHVDSQQFNLYSVFLETCKMLVNSCYTSTVFQCNFVLLTLLQLSSHIDRMKTMIIERQRDINRVITPTIQEGMLTAYEACNTEAGSGMFERMKNHMQQHIEFIKNSLFSGASDVLMNQLVVLEVGGFCFIYI